jgi:hypothetical protein
MEKRISAVREEVRTFWTGPPLSNYEILSLKSLVATGARVILYSYEDDLAVPEGVELRDANEVLSGPVHQFQLANGEITLTWHSDIFRYVMLEKFGGWYADLDIICLKDSLPAAETYFASMQEDFLNSAILKFPKQSPFVSSLLQEALRILPETNNARTAAAFVSIGPGLLTEMVETCGLADSILPRSRAYAIGYAEAVDFLDPAKCEQTLARLSQSDFAHLWNEVWRQLRIPKHMGPPKGSFLDLMFQRFDIDVRERTRLPAEGLRSWAIEHRLIKDIRINLGLEAIDDFTIDQFAYSVQAFGWQPRDRIYNKWHYGIEPEAKSRARCMQTFAPQTLRTFWHGEVIFPYPLMCLRSFVDHGHRVEVFSYNTKMTVPAWLHVRDAAEILPMDRVVGRRMIRDDLFRYELLAKMGGWWLDPDLVLLKPDMPAGDIVFCEPDAFGSIPVSLLKFPPGHPLIVEALNRSAALERSDQVWGRGSSLLSALINDHGLDASNVTIESLGPISWFNVPDLFDPAKAGDLAQKCAKSRFLQLQDDVWRRAGFPPYLAPPEGSYIDTLFARHDNEIRFPTRVAFDQVNRWLRHMYRSAQLDRAAANLI